MLEQNNILYYQYSITTENMTMDIMIEKVPSLSDDDPITNLNNHTHPYAEIFCCIKDKIDVIIPQGICSLNPDEVLIIPPYISHHCLQLPNPGKWERLAFTCRCQPLRKCQDLYSIFLPYLTGTEILVIEDSREIISNIIEINSNYNNDQRFIAGMQLMWRLADYSSKKKWTSHTKKEETKDSNWVRLNKLDQIINTEFMLTRTAAEIAEIIHLSPRQLSRIVENRYGTTLYQVILSKRLETAAILLWDSDLSIEKIAVNVGFPSKVALWREFPKKYGMTPAEYRKLREKQDK